MDNLSRNALLASQAGMSYGKWKALQEIVVPEKKVLPEGWRLCPLCGKEFTGRKNKRHCSKECQLEHYNAKRRKTNKEYVGKCRKVNR